MLDPKKQFYITLTKAVVFLRTSDSSGRLERDWALAFATCHLGTSRRVLAAFAVLAV
jgi:hypothetical protein